MPQWIKQLILPLIVSMLIIAGVCVWSSRDARSQAYGIPSYGFLTFQPGNLTTILGGTAGYFLTSRALVVDNIEGSSLAFVCITSPTVTLFDCGVSSSCASPTTVGNVTITATGGVFDGTVSNANIAAGHYIAWQITAGICTSLNMSIIAETKIN